MKRRAVLHYIPIVLFAGLVLALVIALGHGGGGSNKFALHTNEAAPITDIPLVDASGAHFSTQDWHGRAYLVNFFASWCVPCHAEHEALLALAHDAHIPIIGIAFQDKPEKISAFLGKEGNPFAAIADDHDGKTGIDWGITGVPETYVIDTAGIIRLHIVGPLTEDSVEHQLLPVWKDTKP